MESSYWKWILSQQQLIDSIMLSFMRFMRYLSLMEFIPNRIMERMHSFISILLKPVSLILSMDILLR